MSDGDEPSADETAEQPADEEHEANTASTADAADTDEASEESTTDNDDAATDNDEASDDAGTADGSEDTADEADDTTGDDAGELEERTPESLDARLDEVEADIETAETEADLDAVAERLDEVEADIEAADLPEADEDEDGEESEDEDEEETEDGEITREELESRVTELREAIEAQRGPYAEDAVEEIEGAKSTITETRWTEQGKGEVVTAVESFLDSAGDTLDESFATEGDDEADLATALEGVVGAIEERTLDPDEDEETVATLVDAAEGLVAGLDDAEEWDDLTVREKLDAEGFYDVLSAENKKDFPPEWNAIKIYEKRNEPEPILRGLEMFGSDFMEEHCIESLKRLGSPAAYDAMEQRAQKRNKPPIEVLGKIGDDRALSTLHEYIEGESDPGLQTVTIKAIGEIGSTDSTQSVADRLVAENETVRSNAARALGLIGDTRAVSPLADVLDEDDSNSVRASAAWALNQIGTENALDAAREYGDDRSFLVQTEAEKAERAMTDDSDATGNDTAETAT